MPFTGLTDVMRVLVGFHLEVQALIEKGFFLEQLGKMGSKKQAFVFINVKLTHFGSENSHAQSEFLNKRTC